MFSICLMSLVRVSANNYHYGQFRIHNSQNSAQLSITFICACTYKCTSFSQLNKIRKDKRSDCGQWRDCFFLVFWLYVIEKVHTKDFTPMTDIKMQITLTNMKAIHLFGKRVRLQKNLYSCELFNKYLIFQPKCGLLVWRAVSVNYFFHKII